MIILKGRVPHTTHSHTKHSQKKKLVEIEIQQKKATMPINFKFASYMIKLSVKETKWSSLLARTGALILYISI